MNTEQRIVGTGGKSLILASHELKAAAELCDRLLLLDHGTQHAFGPTREVPTAGSQGAGAAA